MKTLSFYKYRFIFIFTIFLFLFAIPYDAKAVVYTANNVDCNQQGRSNKCNFIIDTTVKDAFQLDWSLGADGFGSFGPSGGKVNFNACLGDSPVMLSGDAQCWYELIDDEVGNGFGCSGNQGNIGNLKGCSYTGQRNVPIPNNFRYAPMEFYGNDAHIWGTVAVSSNDPVVIPPPTPPIINSPTATGITANSAILGANIASLGTPATLSERGTCWGTVSGTLPNCQWDSVTALGPYTQSHGGMPADTVIYYRGHARNDTGIAFSPESSFRTSATPPPTASDPPIINSPTATGITHNSVILGANIASLGTPATLSERGTCWGTVSGTLPNCQSDSVTALGPYTQSHGGMPASTVIYYRGHARNPTGIVYTAQSSFTTNAPPPPAPITTPTVTGVNIKTVGAAPIPVLTVTPDGVTEYEFEVNTSDPGGYAKINRIYALIYTQFGGAYRGYLTWGKTNNWPADKDNRSCGGAGGGWAAIQSVAPSDVYGHGFLNLVSCWAYPTGNDLTIYFKVRFDPSYTTTLTGNYANGYVLNSDGNSSGWMKPAFSNSFNLNITTPIVDSVSLSMPSVIPDGMSQYDIMVSGRDPGGSTKMNEVYAIIYSSDGSPRGFLTWGKNNYWPSDKDSKSCGGSGGYAAIQSTGGNSGYGHENIGLVSCSSSIIGNNIVVWFKVRFNPSYTTSLTGNYINGLLRNLDTNNSGWISSGTFSLEMPSVQNLTISPVPVVAGNGSQYDITITGLSPVYVPSTGVVRISNQYVLINLNGPPANYRGYLTWGKDNYWPGNKNNQGCGGNGGTGGTGGYAAIQSVAPITVAPNSVYGHEHLRLISCTSNVSLSGDTTTVVFRVAFESSFTSPNNNLLFGHVGNIFGHNSGWQQVGTFNLGTTLPTTDSVSISSSSVTPDEISEYDITVTGSDPGGYAKINEVYARLYSSGGSARGFLTWGNANYWPGHKDNKSCTGGGWATIQSLAPNAGSGHGYIYNLVSCNTFASGNSRTTVFKVKFSSTFTTTLIGNYIRGLLVNSDTNSSAWLNSTNFSLNINSLPIVNSPSVSGINYNSAILRANIASLGVPATLSERGTCWGTASGVLPNCQWDGVTALGPYTQSHGGMPSNTTIYFVGYAINPAGTAYSGERSFVTRVDPRVTLTVSVNPGPGGSVTSGDGLINCGGDCSEGYMPGSNVTLTASPTSSYWVFTGWSGACSGTNPVCLISNLIAPTSANATFIPRKFIYKEF